MRKIILTTVMMCAAALAFTQCDYETNQIDEFTGKRRIETADKIMAYSLIARGCKDCDFIARLGYLRDGDKVYMRLIVARSAVWAIEKSAKAMIKFTSGDVLTLYNKEYVVSNYNGNDKDFMPQVGTLYFELTPDHVKALQTNEVDKVRLYLTDGYDNAVTNKKGKKRFVELLTCIDQ